MKMTQKLFERFEAAINETIEEAGDEAVLSHRQSVSFVSDQFVSFCWSVYKVANKRLGFALGDAAYDEGLNDGHMLTAIKKILDDYK